MSGKQSLVLNMDVVQQNLFESFFKSLPEKPATTIRFFNRIEYYSLHGSDAVFTAKEFFRSSAVLKYIGSDDNSLASLILNKSQFEGFVRELLLVKHYRVEVYSKPNKATNNSWTLEFKGSPGNLSQFENLLFSNTDQVAGSGIIAVRLATDNKSKIIGVALVDTTENTFSVCEFTDDDYYSNLESLVVQHTPRECLLPSDVTNVETIKKVIERSGLLVTCRKRSEFNRDDTTQDLNRLIKFDEGQQQSVNALSESKLSTAISALGAIVKYLELCSDEGNFGQFRLQLLDHSRFVHLDSAAVAALSLLPQPGHSTARHHSVLGLLDHCRTQQGHRLMAQWVKQPLRDLTAITERHDVVETLSQATELRQALIEDHLRRIPDLQVLANRLQRKKASMQDCYRIYQALKRFPALIETLEENENSTLQALITTPIKDLISDTEKLLEMIESTLDLDFVDKGEYLIKADFDDDLKELRCKMDSYEEDIKKTLNKAARDLSLEPGKTIKLESNSQYGYFFRVTLKEEKVVRNVKGYTELDANKSGLRFRSSELTELNNDYQQARDEYTQQQEAIVSEVISVAAGYSHTLQSLSHLIAQLDVFTSLALVAVSAPVPYVRPTMHPQGTGILSLQQARHPCLEMQESVSYIANDIYFKQDECTFYMVTGPNMGGKSTYIRSIGVVTLLAHIGSLVPCNSAEISVLDSILARVGASDSQIKGMSTFMVEMVETASIIRTATSNSLVIIDELGRGTSTFEGCGIAWAIAEHLAVTAKSFTLFATHFHELTRLSESVATLANVHVTAITEHDNLTLLYQVRPGACDQSFGIHVAQMAKFPPSVIQDARRKLSELEDYQSLIVAENYGKKRKIIKEGEKIMEEMVEECKKLANQDLLDSDLVIAISKLREEAKAKNNPYITAILAKTE